jgi:hypothetical protein
MTEVVLVCSPDTVATAKGSGNPTYSYQYGSCVTTFEFIFTKNISFV